MFDPTDEPTLGKSSPLDDRLNLAATLKVLPPGCAAFTADNEAAFIVAPGSGSNHQFWMGGYADHLDDLFGIAAVTYKALNDLRPLPFTLEEALLVLFLHDVEKIYKRIDKNTICNQEYKALAATPHDLQLRIIKDYDLVLNEAQKNALKYVHGELDDYSKSKRVAGPLAAFVHNCDYWSARGWYNQPLTDGLLPDLISQED